MNKIKLCIIYIILIITILSLLIYIDTYYHEEAHKQISIYYGCINYDININMFSGSFVCHEYRNTTTQEMLDQENYLHSLNEIKSYNESKYIFMFILIICIIFVHLSFRF